MQFTIQNARGGFAIYTETYDGPRRMSKIVKTMDEALALRLQVISGFHAAEAAFQQRIARECGRCGNW